MSKGVRRSKFLDRFDIPSSKELKEVGEVNFDLKHWFWTLVYVFPVKCIWNWVMVHIFCCSSITIWQLLGLYAIVRFFFRAK